MALSGAVDRLLWIRILWEWLRNCDVKWQHPEQALQEARKAALVTDCRSAYDLLTRSALPQCEEHRTTIECLLIRERLESNCAIRWVTSNAQLADCLTKAMDASTLRACLASGRYCLFDENRVLQERSDRRQRLQWAREATAKQQVANVSTAEAHDFWDQSVPGKLIRVHRKPRACMFTPIGVMDCPVALVNLEGSRCTQVVDASGTRTLHDQWPGNLGAKTLPFVWTGTTTFTILKKV